VEPGAQKPPVQEQAAQESLVEVHSGSDPQPPEGRPAAITAHAAANQRNRVTALKVRGTLGVACSNAFSLTNVTWFQIDSRQGQCLTDPTRPGTRGRGSGERGWTAKRAGSPHLSLFAARRVSCSASFTTSASEEESCSTKTGDKIAKDQMLLNLAVVLAGDSECAAYHVGPSGRLASHCPKLVQYRPFTQNNDMLLHFSAK
jgi:hypothetical protein